jgi:hypothetical protein
MYGGGIMMEAMWFEIKSKVGNILSNIIYRSQIEAGSLFWRNFAPDGELSS